MKSRQIYLYLKNADEDTLVAFLSSYPGLTILKKNDGMLVAAAEYDFDLSTLQALRELSIQEFYQDFSCFIVPESADFPITPVVLQLPRLTRGVYTVESIIPEIVFLNLTALKLSLKNYYLQLVGTETIDSVLGFVKENLNASQAAKRLFMHRNTLNYRLDHFVTKTGIDIRTFKGALAIYLLFRP